KTQLYELQMPIDWNGVENDLGDFKNNHEIQLSKRCVTNELESFIQNSLIEWDFPEARATFYALCNTREEALEIFQRKWSEYRANDRVLSPREIHPLLISQFIPDIATFICEYLNSELLFRKKKAACAKRICWIQIMNRFGGNFEIEERIRSFCGNLDGFDWKSTRFIAEADQLLRYWLGIEIRHLIVRDTDCDRWIRSITPKSELSEQEIEEITPKFFRLFIRVFFTFQFNIGERNRSDYPATMGYVGLFYPNIYFYWRQRSQKPLMYVAKDFASLVNLLNLYERYALLRGFAEFETAI